MTHNIALQTDSYKLSQFLQYPPDTTHISSYIEARGGKYKDKYDETVFAGLQPYLIEYLSKPFTKEDFDEIESIAAPHGLPFNQAGWKVLLEEHGGYVPLEIQAVPEGFVMPMGNVQVQMVNTDPRFFWLTSYIETAILRAVWYMSTVATHSRESKKMIANALYETSDVPIEDQIDFKLHDFGARGATSSESAKLGGIGHLINFKGTDTIEAIAGARKYYKENIAGFSIPASEHSTMTSWGQEGETDAYKNMLEVFGGAGKILACVSDSYNIFNAVRNIWGKELKDKVINSGGTLVVRPDSGNPYMVPIEVIKILMEKFGFTVNSKGYKVLPPYIRVIQGDGLDHDSLSRIIVNIAESGLSMDNIAFGMGSGINQKVHRDDLGYAMKASARRGTDGVWNDVFKDPIAGNKTSKKGRLALVRSSSLSGGVIRTVREEEVHDQERLMVPVFRNGKILKEYTFAEVRENAKILEPKPRMGSYE